MHFPHSTKGVASFAHFRLPKVCLFVGRNPPNQAGQSLFAFHSVCTLGVSCPSLVASGIGNISWET